MLQILSVKKTQVHLVVSWGRFRLIAGCVWQLVHRGAHSIGSQWQCIIVCFKESFVLLCIFLLQAKCVRKEPVQAVGSVVAGSHVWIRLVRSEELCAALCWCGGEEWIFLPK